METGYGHRSIKQGSRQDIETQCKELLQTLCLSDSPMMMARRKKTLKDLLVWGNCVLKIKNAFNTRGPVWVCYSREIITFLRDEFEIRVRAHISCSTCVLYYVTVMDPRCTLD